MLHFFCIIFRNPTIPFSFSFFPFFFLSFRDNSVAILNKLYSVRVSQKQEKAKKKEEEERDGKEIDSNGTKCDFETFKY